MLKVGIFNKYLSTLGGGEKDTCVMAEALSGTGRFKVELVTDKQVELKTIEERFNLDLSKVGIRRVRPYINRYRIKALGKLYFTRLSKPYDIFVNLVNNPPYPNFAREGVLRIQFPFTAIDGPCRELPQYRHKLVYSEYAREWVEKRWGVQSEVLHPPVEIFSPGEKKNIILSVGRFFFGFHNKKHLNMIYAFKHLCDNGLKGWEYHLIGNTQGRPEDRAYLKTVWDFARGYPIFIHNNAPFKALREYYEKSRIFVHATGYGEDPEMNPEMYEHFGLTTVEAMSAGCVPVVINGGGQPELVEHGVSGLLWNTEKELADSLLRLTSDGGLWSTMSAAAVERSAMYSKEKFKERVVTLFDRIASELE